MVNPQTEPSAPLNRKRKTKNPCSICRMHQERCICHLIPSLDLKTQVVLIAHYKELKRTTNTGTLALRALSNSRLVTRGIGSEKLDLSGYLDSQYQSLLLYPESDANELTEKFISQFNKPIRLIVPDGNWRQASKVSHRHPELSDVPKVKIKIKNSATQHLRAESSSYGMSTIQAIAYSLKVIEGDGPFCSLQELYFAKLKQTLIGRGQRNLPVTEE